jgi:hypothetical protein
MRGLLLDKSLIILNCRTLFVSGAGLESAKSLIASYKQNRVPVMTPELWSAKKIVDATLHPGMGTCIYLYQTIG